MSNTKHPHRTLLYMGFVYLLCENSPGFDEYPKPESMLTLTDLLEYGFEGELPAEIVNISLPDEKESVHDTDTETPVEEQLADAEAETGAMQVEPELGDDDTEIVAREDQEASEDEIDDLLANYEELLFDI